MKIKKTLLLVLILAMLLPTTHPINAANLKWHTQKILELGKTGDPFYSLTSACEDNEENIYVLDNKQYKIRKFSKTGKELLQFGGRGEGPQEWRYPSKIYFSKNKELVVTEIRNFASIFTDTGKPIKRINFAKYKEGLNYIQYVGDNLFYGVIQRMLESQQQILIYADGSQLNINLFSTTGGMIKMPNGSRFMMKVVEIFPTLVFESCKDFCIAGVSDKYQFKLLDSHGKLIRIIKRDISSQPLSNKERQYFTNFFRQDSEMPISAQDKFIQLIPQHKMYCYTAKLTSNYIFVFRIKADTTTNKPPYPVDVFAITGEFLGEVEMPKLPLLITDKYLYIEEGDDANEDDAISLVKYHYQINR